MRAIVGIYFYGSLIVKTFADRQRVVFLELALARSRTFITFRVIYYIWGLSNVTRSQKNKTVTFKICLLPIYGRNINDFHALPHAFPLRWFNPTFASPWRAANDRSNFELISYRNNLDENYSYIFLKQGPYWIVIAKEDWLLYFRWNTILALPWTKNEPNRFFDRGHDFVIFLSFLLTFTLNNLRFPFSSL